MSKIQIEAMKLKMRLAIGFIKENPELITEAVKIAKGDSELKKLLEQQGVRLD